VSQERKSRGAVHTLQLICRGEKTADNAVGCSRDVDRRQIQGQKERQQQQQQQQTPMYHRYAPHRREAVCFMSMSCGRRANDRAPRFLPRDAVLARVLAIGLRLRVSVCVCVCVCVCLSHASVVSTRLHGSR